MEASFAEKTARKGQTYRCSSSAINSFVTCNHSTMPELNTAESTPSHVYSKNGVAIQRPKSYPHAFDIALVFHTLISLFGVIGNALTLYVLGYLKKKRNTEDIFVLSLASADILPSLLVVANIVVMFMQNKCDNKCMQCLQRVSTGIYRVASCASAWFLVFISFNRYRVISRPLAPDKSKSMVYSRVLFVWLSSLIATVPGLLSLRMYYYLFNLVTITFFYIYSMFIPGIIILVVYCLSGIALKANTLKHENVRAMTLRKKQNANVLKIFAVVTISFFILTMPYGIRNICVSYMYRHNSMHVLYEPTYHPEDVLSMLFYTNFCVNPIIYAKMHREISIYLRKLIQEIKRGCCQCCSKRNQEALLK